MVSAYGPATGSASDSGSRDDTVAVAVVLATAAVLTLGIGAIFYAEAAGVFLASTNTMATEAAGTAGATTVLTQLADGDEISYAGQRLFVIGS